MSTQLWIICASWLIAFFVVFPFWRLLTYDEDVEEYQRDYNQRKRIVKTTQTSNHDDYLNEYGRKRG